MGAGLPDGVYFCTGYLQKVDDPGCIWVSVMKGSDICNHDSTPIPYKRVRQESFINYIRKVRPINRFYFTVQNDSIEITYTMLK